MPGDDRRVPRHGEPSARSGRRARRSSASRRSLDRFSQIEPKVLLAVDGYRYGAKRSTGAPRWQRIRAGAADLEATVGRCRTSRRRDLRRPDADRWADLVRDAGDARVRAGPVRPPALRPVLLGHDRAAEGDRARPRRHPARAPEGARAPPDLGPGDRFFWFTTTGWMMWNYLVSGLLGARRSSSSTATPAIPTATRSGGSLQTTASRLRDERAVPHRVPQGGAASRRTRSTCRACARRLDRRAAAAGGLPLGARAVGDATSCSTPSPAAPTSARRSSAGARSSRSAPARSPCRYLGRAGGGVRRRRATGRRRAGRAGASPQPMPSMPVGFWGDDDGARYRAELLRPTSPACGGTATGSRSPSAARCVITGRSDATLNRGGVRIGTSEIYAVVEAAAGGRRQPRRPPRGRCRRPRASCSCSSRCVPGVDLDDRAGRPHQGGYARACRRATCPTGSRRCPSSRGR